MQLTENDWIKTKKKKIKTKRCSMITNF